MAYTIDYDPENDIMITAWLGTFKMENDFESFRDELMNELDQLDHTVGIVYDMTEVNLGFDDMMIAAGSARGENAITKHPNVGKIAVIANNRLIRMAAKGMDSLPFGNLKMNVVGTREEAVSYLS